MRNQDKNAVDLSIRWRHLHHGFSTVSAIQPRSNLVLALAGAQLYRHRNPMNVTSAMGRFWPEWVGSGHWLIYFLPDSDPLVSLAIGLSEGSTRRVTMVAMESIKATS